MDAISVAFPPPPPTPQRALRSVGEMWDLIDTEARLAERRTKDEQNKAE